MCGIAGIIDFKNQIIKSDDIKSLIDQMKHRGPDGEGIYLDRNIGFGHRRLSIIDLSKAANQPMLYHDKYVITYNGEIYNYLEIKTELEKAGYIFKTKSDTEVILAAYDQYGTKCLEHFNGMWAFALYDKEKNILFCSRDRFGIKPFYYSLKNNRFIFSSEMKPILSTLPGALVNKKILMEYLVLNLTDHTEETFFDGIKTLRGSHYMIINLTNYDVNIEKYYDINFSHEVNQLNLKDATRLYQNEFDRSITWRLRSDVKVGTCLSGGLDSSYIAAIASSKYHLESDEQFNAITAEALDPRFNEVMYAKTVVDHLNLKWHVTTPVRYDYESYIYELVRLHEEPFGSLSIFLQNQVMKEANNAGVVVLLDGQGADETVLGYSRYIPAYSKTLSLPKKINFLLNAKNNYGISFSYLVQNQLYFSSYKIRKSRVLHRLRDLNNEFLNTIDFTNIKELADSQRDLFKLQKLELFKTQIPQLLKWEDKNSMAYSIETRLPFLDYKLVETSLSINNEFKLGFSWSKFIMRKAMEDRLPDSIVWRRKKVGFAAPSESWLSKSKFWVDVERSPLLNKIFNNHIPVPKDINLYWRICNIALWEKMLNVTL
jgi:asparagine synthase (glutamine-hydrolysing)